MRARAFFAVMASSSDQAAADLARTVATSDRAWFDALEERLQAVPSPSGSSMPAGQSARMADMRLTQNLINGLGERPFWRDQPFAKRLDAAAFWQRVYQLHTWFSEQSDQALASIAARMGPQSYAADTPFHKHYTLYALTHTELLELALHFESRGEVAQLRAVQDHVQRRFAAQASEAPAPASTAVPVVGTIAARAHPPEMYAMRASLERTAEGFARIGTPLNTHIAGLFRVLLQNYDQLSVEQIDNALHALRSVILALQFN